MRIQDLIRRLKVFPADGNVIARWGYLSVEWHTVYGERRVMSVSIDDPEGKATYAVDAKADQISAVQSITTDSQPEGQDEGGTARESVPGTPPKG
jgi:hypothetical protein